MALAKSHALALQSEAAVRAREAAVVCRELEEATLCQVCMDAPKDTALIPCGHRTCETCAKRFLNERPKLCPICRSSITSHIRVF